MKRFKARLLGKEDGRTGFVKGCSRVWLTGDVDLNSSGKMNLVTPDEI